MCENPLERTINIFISLVLIELTFKDGKLTELAFAKKFTQFSKLDGPELELIRDLKTFLAGRQRYM